MWIASLVLLVVFLLGSFLIQVVSSAFRALEHTRSREELKEFQDRFIFRALQRRLFADRELETLFFSISCTKHLLRYGFVLVTTLFIVSTSFALDPYALGLQEVSFGDIWLPLVLELIGFLLVSLIVGDFLPRWVGTTRPATSLKFCAPGTSLYLLVTFPICLLIAWLSPRPFIALYVERVREPVTAMTGKIIEMLGEAGQESVEDAEERKLLTSIATFRDLIVREVMVPRTEMWCIDGETTIRQAAERLGEEGYSRAPVYGDSIDQILGVVLYKDLMNVYHDCEGLEDRSPLEQPVSTIVKPVIFVPEISRVSNLLRQLQQGHIHLAIVVDEYGGTEGMVTIEDCLEEIVGEIEDEYDVDEEAEAVQQPDGSWIVDARMYLSDVAELIGLKVPQEGDYETIGGYVYHRAGEIPVKGLQIHHDEFIIEILQSSERRVEKLKITKQAD